MVSVRWFLGVLLRSWIRSSGSSIPPRRALRSLLDVIRDVLKESWEMMVEVSQTSGKPCSHKRDADLRVRCFGSLKPYCGVLSG